MDFEERYRALLARRVPLGAVVVGRAYVVHARNGGVGVAVRENGLLGYRLHREKFGRHYFFVELDWNAGEPFGTAIPLATISEESPTDEQALLFWLRSQEEEHRFEIDAAWRTVLGQSEHS